MLPPLPEAVGSPLSPSTSRDTQDLTLRPRTTPIQPRGSSDRPRLTRPPRQPCHVLPAPACASLQPRLLQLPRTC